jgi:hypothetical protein
MSDEEQPYYFAHDIYTRLVEAGKKYNVKVLCKTTTCRSGYDKTTFRLRPGYKMDMSAYNAVHRKADREGNIIVSQKPLKQSIDFRITGWGMREIEGKRFIRGDRMQWIDSCYAIVDGEGTPRRKMISVGSVPPVTMDNLDMLNNLVKIAAQIFTNKNDVSKEILKWDHDASKVKWSEFNQEEYARSLSEKRKTRHGMHAEVTLNYIRQATYQGAGLVENGIFTLTENNELQKENKDPSVKIAFLFYVVWQSSDLGNGYLSARKKDANATGNKLVYDGKSYCFIDEVTMTLSDKKMDCQLNKHDKHLLDMTMRYFFEEKVEEKDKVAS